MKTVHSSTLVDMEIISSYLDKISAKNEIKDLGIFLSRIEATVQIWMDFYLPVNSKSRKRSDLNFIPQTEAIDQ